MKNYGQLNKYYQDKYNDYTSKYGFYAYNKQQVDEGINKHPKDSKFSNCGQGLFMLENKAKGLIDLFNEQEKALKEAMQQPVFAYDAFNYELSNHEYCVSGDPDDALAMLDLTLEQVQQDKILLKAFKKAVTRQNNQEW